MYDLVIQSDSPCVHLVHHNPQVSDVLTSALILIIFTALILISRRFLP